MRLNKKVVECAAVLGMTAIMAITAVTTGEAPAEVCKQEVSEAAGISLEDEAVAGVTAALYEYQKAAADETVAKVSVVSEEVEIVSAAAEEAVTEDVDTAEKLESQKEDSKESSMSKEEQKWQDYLMADVEQSLNVRKKADDDAEIVGKLYKGDRAKIIKVGDEWTKVESGNVKGYVKNSYCLTGTKALKYAKKNCDTVAKVNTDGLRIRSKQSTDGKVVDAVAAGTVLKVNTKKKTKDGWVAVVYENDLCYVSEDYVDVSLKTGKGVTLEEEAAARAAEEAAKKAAAEAEAAKQAAASSSSSSSQSSGAATTQRAAVSASVDDVTLLAAIIQCEAGGCSYEGKLAVGAVVMNRVKSGSFPNSISGVIYQSGQFSPVRTGKLASRLANGVSSSCRQAAQAAISGQDNTNGAKYFRYASSGQSGVVYGRVVFY